MSFENLPLRHAWVEVDLSAIEYNTRRLVELAAGAELLAMVKANAYGHGAIETARAILRGGASWLGVFTVGEGIELRAAGITAPILVVGYTPPPWTRAALEKNLTLNVFTIDTACALAEAARALNTRARIHIKIDTGLSRLGVLPADALDFVRAVRDLRNIEIEGLMTHFAMADTPDAFGVMGWGDAYTQKQLTIFRDVIATLENDGVTVRYKHCANSPTILNLPDAFFNLVRAGILLYGLDPSPEVPAPSDFKRALSYKTQVAIIKSVPAGTYVSYGCTFRTERPSRLAILLVGYADGFRRKPANYGQVLIRGRRVSIVGRVAMDQAIADVTDFEDIVAGDEVVLIGSQGAEEIRAEEVADRLGTNNYETIATISARVERKYI